MAKTDMADASETIEGSDAPLIDLNDASVKKVIARAKSVATSPTTSLTKRCRRAR